jgi:hypothetical protein
VNFGELKAEIIRIGKRADVTGVAGNYVARAESMIAQHVRALEMISGVSIGEAQRYTPTSGLYDCPDGTIDVIDVFSGTTALQRVPVTELLRFLSGGPVHSYSVRGNVGDVRIDFRAIPATGASFSALIVAKPSALVSDADTGALLAAWPELYLHGALHWLHLEEQDIDLAQIHRDLFMATADKVNALAHKATDSRSITLDTPAAVPLLGGGPM